MFDQPNFTELFLNGDPGVLGHIYQKSFAKVCGYIIKSGGSELEAEDIFQNALVQLFVKIKNKELEIKNFEHYLFTVCKNLWRKEISNKMRVTDSDIVPLKSEEIDETSFYLEQSQWELYNEKFQLLSDKCKELLTMLFAKSPYSEIRSRFDFASDTAARQRVFKCKAKLIDLIKKDKKYKKLKE